jgi:predicted O-methyltransferase YrrM
VIRTVSDEDFEFEIYEINLFEGVSSQNLQNDLNQKWKSCINEIKLFKELMSFFDLNPTNLNTESRPTLHSNGWLMEQSSSWLLVEIAKSFSKPKILEIGTWEGYTASILLKNTDAFIWTIDRDERIDTSIYPSRYSSLSSPDSQEVGWLYKTLDYENRVKEIISDSTLFNWDKFEDETFDIVFIDGDHSENAAYLDTINSFPKLRKSGICIWDDFSFDGFSMTDAERGVTNFVENNLKWLNDNFELAYLHGTQFLLGKKR